MKWLQRFADQKGPQWEGDWAKLETRQRVVHEPDTFRASATRRRVRLRRRDYGLDMGIVLAAFGHLPALAEAATKTERTHWLSVTHEILGAFLRTLPNVTKATADSEWAYDHWRADEAVLKRVATRVCESTTTERRTLWKPFVRLPGAAHHHITCFLKDVLLECLRPEPPLIVQLQPIWREMVAGWSSRPVRASARHREQNEVWRVLLLYGSSMSSTGEEFFRPIVEDLRTYFESHAKGLGDDAHEQGLLARYFTTKAGELLLVDALVWMHPSWEEADDYFWEQVAEDDGLERLLEHAWKTKFARVRQNAAAFAAFKTLTLNLATRQSAIALQVQEKIGKI
jgi:hypothetical protein